jgi:hypothetical protein
MTNDYGTDPHKLHRKSDPDTSTEAAHRVDSSTWELRMHQFIKSCGFQGGTPKQALAAFPGVPYSTVTARFKALKDKGLVIDTGRRIDRSAVLVASEYADGKAQSPVIQQNLEM